MQLLHSTSLILLVSALPHLSAAPARPHQQPIIPSDNTSPSLSSSYLIHDALTHSSCIPDVLNDFEPTYSLSISYPSSHESVQLGNNIPVASVSSRPVFEFHAIASSDDRDRSNARGSSLDFGSESTRVDASKKTFTLVLTDPDATSRDNPKWSEMCHWIVTNLTEASATVDTFVRTGKRGEEGELVEYLPPGPPPQTGNHRYVFVLLQSLDEGHALNPPQARKHWGYGRVRHGVRDWAEENGLKVVGANFFYAHHLDTVGL